MSCKKLGASAHEISAHCCSIFSVFAREFFVPESDSEGFCFSGFLRVGSGRPVPRNCRPVAGQVAETLEEFEVPMPKSGCKNGNMF